MRDLDTVRGRVPHDPSWTRETMNPSELAAGHGARSEGTPTERTSEAGGGRRAGRPEYRGAKAGAATVPPPARTLADWLAIPAHDAEGRCYCGPAGCANDRSRS